MTLKKVKEVLKAEVIWGVDQLQMEVRMGCGSDLMSDVLAFTKPSSLLLTGLTNPQAVRTAEMSDVKAICFVRGKKPDNKTVELAKEKKIPLLLTTLPMFEACGRLYKEGLVGCSEIDE